MSFWSKLKSGLRNPREALRYLALTPEEYYHLRLERMEHDVEPNNVLEKHMSKLTDIHEHLQTLYMLTVELNLRVIVELGTGGGESTIALLEAAKQIGGRVYSLDVSPCLEAKAKIRAYELSKYWEFIQGDDLKIEWNKPISHLFIDTTHTYDQTIKELKKYEPLVMSGGIITLHDIVLHPEVLQAINEYLKGRTDLHLYKYLNCNGLAVIFKRA